MSHQHQHKASSPSGGGGGGSPVSVIRNNVVAGYAAGISGTLVGHPMDSLKVWMQTNRTMANQQQLFSSNSSKSSAPTTTTAVTSTASSRGGPTSSASASSTPMTPRLSVEKIPASSSSTSRAMSTLTMPVATTAMSKTRLLQCRLRALYAGISGPLFAVGFVQSINFAVYDTSRRILYYGWNDYSRSNVSNKNNKTEYLQHDSLTNIAISSMAAGAVLACFTSPLMIIKTKQQLQGMSFRQAVREVFLGTTTSSHQGLVSSISQRTSNNSMYTGFAPHLICETMGRCIYMCSYEALKRHFSKNNNKELQGDDSSLSHNNKVSLSTRMLSAACAGILSTATVYPMDVIRCRFYAQTNNVPVQERKNMRQLIQTIYQERGGSIRGFYRGFGVTILRAGPVAAAVLPIYDITLEALNDGYFCSSPPL